MNQFGRISFAFIFIYLLLSFSAVTYFLPALRISLPGIKDLQWSVADMVKVLPKPGFQKKEKPAVDINFKELLEKIFPEPENKAMEFKITPQLIAVAVMPIALALAYVMLLLAILVSLIRSRFLVRWSSGLAMVFSAYALGAIYLLADVAKDQFSGEVDPIKNPFQYLGRVFAKEIVVAPETGLYALVIFTALLFVFTYFRPSKLY